MSIFMGVKMADVKQINLTDGDIEDITITLGKEEAAAILAIFGKMNYHAQLKLGIARINYGIYDALADVFNRFYEDGVDEVCRIGDLSDLNTDPNA